MTFVKTPQTGWLKKTEMYCFTVVETVGLKSSKTVIPLKSLENFSLSLLASDVCWQPLVLLGVQMHHFNLCLHHDMAFSLWVSDSSFLRTPHLSFPGGLDGKASACNATDLGSIPGSGRSPGRGNGNPLQYSCLKNSTDGGDYLHGGRLQSMGSQRVRHD